MGKPVAVVVGVGAELGLGAALCRRFAAGGFVLSRGEPQQIEQSREHRAQGAARNRW